MTTRRWWLGATLLTLGCSADPTGDSPAACSAATICSGDVVQRCNDDGTPGDVVEICSLQCDRGACVNTCEAAEAVYSNLGCEFWAVDLDNAMEVGGPPGPGGTCSGIWTGTAPVDDIPVCHDGAGRIGGECDHGSDCSSLGDAYTCGATPVCILDAQHSPFAIVVANPDAASDTAVTIENTSGMSRTIAVGAQEVIAIYPQALGFPDQSLDHSSIAANAYRVTSTTPIVAYQFNPLEDVGVFSNDASLLLPAHALGSAYRGVSLPTASRGGPARDHDGYLTIVATEPGGTTITVTPTGRVRPGGIPEILPGEPRSFTLARFEALTLAAAGREPGEPGWDLSGTSIEGSAPFAVFGGHEAGYVEDPGAGACCLDHVEEQLFSTSTWGEHYAIARSQQRSQERDLLRIVAQRPGTIVEFHPASPAAVCPPLGPGELCDVFIERDTEISASEPVLVAQYLTAIAEDGDSSGDPSMAIVPPSEQYRRTYSFLVPAHYAHHHAAIAARAGGPVVLDGVDVSDQLVPFGDGFAGGRIPLEAGHHRLDCLSGCGLMVHGWSHKVSYMFAGGLNLDPIVIR